MINNFETIIAWFSDKPKRIFLVDTIGGFLTAFLLVAILARFEELAGMPTTVLYLLALIASVYMFYSLVCFLFLKDSYRLFLMIIAIANIIYCCVTLCLALYFYSSLTLIGLIYFLLETLVIGLVVFIEFSVYNRLP